MRETMVLSRHGLKGLFRVLSVHYGGLLVGLVRSRVVIITILLTIFVVVATSFCMTPAAAPARDARSLAIYYSKDRSETFALVADYEFSQTRLTIDQEATSISELRLFVRRASIDETRNWKPLEIQYPNRWEFRGFSATPLWEKGFVAREDFILPTGEFFDSNSVGLCCIVFDGRFRLFQFDRAKDAFVETDAGNELKAELRSWYSRCYKVDDVYWSYGLVKHPEFFGRKSIDLSKAFKSPPLLKTEELFDVWKKISGQL